MIEIYIEVIAQEGDQVAGWFVAGLAAAAILSLYGVARAVPWRGWALAVSGVAMAVLGFVSILSIGFPILCAGVLALVAAVRSSNITRARPLSNRGQ
jgi:predicted membrane metal-binding protein